MKGVTILSAMLGAVGLLVVSAVTAGAQAESPTPTITSFSQYLRAIGHNLSPDEAAFFDADEPIQAAFTQPLVHLDLLVQVSPEQRNDQWRQAVLSELTRLVALDPSNAPPAPPRLQRLRELGIAQRTHVWRAARQWLEALEQDDPDWLERGGDEFRAARERMAEWQRELLSIYPYPQPSQP
ncbi:MAG TPA: hypothetical protein VFB73_07585 [Chloroflexota bacterium]|nr:hypothetical protein [Chloroflexota bacterium]